MSPLTRVLITFAVTLATNYLRRLLLDWLGVA